MHRRYSHGGAATVWAAGIALTMIAAAPAAGQQVWRLDGDALTPVQPPEPDSPEALIAHARQRYVEGHYRQARKILDDWLKENPYEPQSDMALLYLGDCQYKLRDYWKSYETYERLVNNFSGSRAYRLALGRQFKVALMFLSGTRSKWLGLRIVDMTEEAVRLLDRIRDREEGTLLAEKCLLATANYYYQKADFFDAEYRYALYLQLYPNGSAAREALWRLAWCYQGLYRGSQYDASALEQAQQTFRRFAREYPQTQEAEQVNDLLDRIRWSQARNDFQVARYYLRTGQPAAAAYYFRSIIAEYGDTEWAASSERELVRLGYAAPAEDQETPEPQ